MNKADHITGIRYLTEEEVRLMKSRVEAVGEDISREELIRGLEDCYIWEEEWTRETGHMWYYHTLLKRTPSQDEYDYADTWSFSPVKLANFSNEAIIRMLNAEK